MKTQKITLTKSFQSGSSSLSVIQTVSGTYKVVLIHDGSIVNTKKLSIVK